MNTHKASWITPIITLIGIVIILATLPLMLSNIDNKLDQFIENCNDIDTKLSYLVNRDTETSDNMFMLKAYNGIIGVFNEHGELTDIIEVDIKSLPRQDQTMLETGIWAASHQELASLIEDYTG